MEERDYTSFPEGLRNLAQDLDLPQATDAEKEAFLWSVIDSLIKTDWWFYE